MPHSGFIFTRSSTTHRLAAIPSIGTLGFKECLARSRFALANVPFGNAATMPVGYARSAPQFPLCLHFGRRDRLNAKTDLKSLSGIFSLSSSSFAVREHFDERKRGVA